MCQTLPSFNLAEYALPTMQQGNQNTIPTRSKPMFPAYSLPALYVADWIPIPILLKTVENTPLPSYIPSKIKINNFIFRACPRFLGAGSGYPLYSFLPSVVPLLSLTHPEASSVFIPYGYPKEKKSGIYRTIKQKWIHLAYVRGRIKPKFRYYIDLTFNIDPINEKDILVYLKSISSLIISSIQFSKTITA